jgi:capsular polysaccharide transport system ATP-binding protein
VLLGNRAGALRRLDADGDERRLRYVSDRVISLHSVNKTVFSHQHGATLMFARTSFVVPTDRRVAILGDRQSGKSLLLRLMARTEAPDTGEVIAPAGLGPIANSKSVFHPRLTGTENIRMMARVHCVDSQRLLQAVEAMSQLGKAIELPFALLNGQQRLVLELAVLSALPFGCYLLDDAFRMPQSLLEKHFSTAECKGSGVIFTTVVPRQVYEYADCVIVIRNKTARAFTQPREAIESYERKSA